ncbi:MULTISPECIES: hypothetical protein [Pseudomonas]|jgi:hypothetical protein|uniref:Uncharacterized protein n=1 Tax=Pseudomonas umsongensis TaxID=198618 RepID=A0ACC5M8K5_9PSED|nr:MULTISPECIES: hypothetical protein [Pseudomonas]MBB2885047.1 hypothetical protein [Pseudomonas umsongensis]NMN74691.1 hypothetical protein [Pseudomonas sp. KD5]
MTTSPFSIPNGAIKKNLKRIVDHWVVVSLMLSGAGTLFGFAILSTYLNAIGLPGLFPSALDTKAALVPWMLLVALLLIAYIFVLTMNSMIFASGATLFNKQPYVQTKMVRLLAIPVLVGISVQMSTIVGDIHPLLTILASALAEIVVFFVLMKSERFRVAIHVVGFMARPEEGMKWQARFGALVPLFIVVFSTVLSAVFPVQLVLSTYPTPTDIESSLKLAGMAIFVSSLALVPAVIFFAFGENLLAKIRNTLAVLMIMTVAMLTMAPRTFPAMVYRTAYLMGLRDTTITSYLITDTYSVDYFDSDWGKVSIDKDRPVVRGFPLLSLGDLLILCPAYLVTTELAEWPARSPACLVTDTKTAKRVPEKQAKKRWAKAQMYEV